MPIVDMLDEAIWSGIEACNKHIEAIAKHQRFVATGEGNPHDENACLQMMISNIRLLQDQQQLIASYTAELARRHVSPRGNP